MAVVVNATNFNGTLNDYLYLVKTVGLDTVKKGLIHILAGVSSKTQLDYMKSDANPIETYTDGAPTFPGVVTKYKKDLTPVKMTVSGTIVPTAWLSVWEKYRSQGTLTQLRENPVFMREVMDLIFDSTAEQLDKLIWQGDTGGAAALAFFDGLIKLINADADKIVVTPAGNITTANVVDILEAVYEKIPDKFYENPDNKIIMSTTDFRKLQSANLSAKKTTTGVLSQGIENMFLNHRILHTANLTANYIIAANASVLPQSNLVMGVYYNLIAEAGDVILDYTTNHSKTVGYRFDFMAAVQIRYGGDIVFYKPA